MCLALHIPYLVYVWSGQLLRCLLTLWDKYGRWKQHQRTKESVLMWWLPEKLGRNRVRKLTSCTLGWQSSSKDRASDRWGTAGSGFAASWFDLQCEHVLDKIHIYIQMVTLLPITMVLRRKYLLIYCTGQPYNVLQWNTCVQVFLCDPTQSYHTHIIIFTMVKAVDYHTINCSGFWIITYLMYSTISYTNSWVRKPIHYLIP